jgi:hypothetical protein
MADIITSLEWLNESKVAAGITMLMLNLGAKHVAADLTNLHESVLKHPLFKGLIVMSLFFVATRDVKTTLVLAVGYLVIMYALFHDMSILSLLPVGMRSPHVQSDFDPTGAYDDYVRRMKSVR